MRKLLVIPILFSLVACEPQEQAPKYSDKTILAAREYVAYYDERMKRVEAYITKCTEQIPVEKRSEIYPKCSETAYDMNGFFRGDNGTIHRDEKQRYQENMKIAKNYLSTDVE